MTGKYFLQGKDNLVLMGSFIAGVELQINVYKPEEGNEIIPRIDMTQGELAHCIPPGTPSVSIPRKAVKILCIGKQSFDPNEDYWGRGKVSIEIKKDAQGANELVEKILSSGVGLEQSDVSKNYL